MNGKRPETLTLDRMATPIGEAVIATDAEGVLCAVDWEDYFEARMRRLLERHHRGANISTGRAPAAVRAAFEAYFAGRIDALDDLAWRTNGTAFQQAVWAALCEIPAGETRSYSALAARVGRPAAVRAVGLANGSNPISLVVPCHRVIGADGSLTGYGGGLERKRWLLAHEGAAAS
ncbi:methylated-DNA--[protein]-cysteine S-methyltransferase [Phenylobacterium sp.]|uniref:methylated-DNA--[protein]-cysteine S-methyltransferase n=1 Tax=Phenylobacterium sp. TaxID=1871053 RepID=UPI0035B3AC07